MNITIKTIPHKEQRYDTVGDWVFDADGNLAITVSEMTDWRHEMLVAFHELAEALLCEARGIPGAAVDAFDRAYDPGFTEPVEPGDHPNAPYRREHFFATTVERMLCAELGVAWHDYDAAVGGVT